MLSIIDHSQHIDQYRQVCGSDNIKDESFILTLKLWRFASNNLEVALVCEDGNFFGPISGFNWWLQATRSFVVWEEQEIRIFEGDMGGGGGGEGGQGGEEALDAAGQHPHWLLACGYLVLPHQAHVICQYSRYFKQIFNANLM